MVHVFFFFFYLYGDHRDLHSFPTRRSSDLASRIAVPGHTADSGALNTSSCELASMLPQEGAGGWMPRPRKLNALSARIAPRSEEHTSELQSRQYLVCRLLLEKKKNYPLSLD